MEITSGLHIVGRVKIPDQFVPYSPAKYVQRCIEIVKMNGLTYCTHALHEFGGLAFTAAIVLSESHVTLHTWYENQYVDMDVFVCSVTRDNRDAARRVFRQIAAMFGDAFLDYQEILR